MNPVISPLAIADAVAVLGLPDAPPPSRDIVTTLRERASSLRLAPRDGWHAYLFDEAADEIERLRFGLRRGR
jgi:hypothetical protein